MTEVVIITGLSGSGKTKASDWFEDQGYYFVDNLPPALMNDIIDLIRNSKRKIKKIAMIIDVRGGEFFQTLNHNLDLLKSREGIDLKILFVEASDDTLVRRYNESRRSHPLTSSAVTKEVIQTERRQLQELRKRADFVLDTSNMKVSDLKKAIINIFVDKHEKLAFSINIMSFGYKHGMPREADIIFDVRFMPNPYYFSHMKYLTGVDSTVSQYVLSQQVTKDFIYKLDDMINFLIPSYEQEGKYHLNLGIGCTGGQHRSVAIACELGKIFTKQGKRINVTHINMANSNT